MAGDWMKLELTTPDKPEVHAIAEILAISPEQVLGGLIRAWIWADQQSRFGHASVTHLSLDFISHVTGLAAAMEKVGWLVIENGTMSFPHFDRHNGKTAKTRALAFRRKRIERSRKGHASTVTKTGQQRDQSTETEKKKKNKDTPIIPLEGEQSVSKRSSPGKPTKTQLPEHFGESWSPAMSAWLAKHCPNGELEPRLEHFIGYVRANGKTYADWEQAFQNAIRGNWAKIEAKRDDWRKEVI